MPPIADNDRLVESDLEDEDHGRGHPVTGAQDHAATDLGPKTGGPDLKTDGPNLKTDGPGTDDPDQGKGVTHGRRGIGHLGMIGKAVPLTIYRFIRFVCS